MTTWCVILLTALALAGCGPSDPSVRISGNSAPVTVNFTDGSSSPIGTAPCGASSSQKGVTQPTGPDCSTTTDDHSNAPVVP